MKRHILKSIIALVAISLLGIVATQTFWLKKSVRIAEQQFDDRADRMLSEVKEEMKEYVDTSLAIQGIPSDSLILFDVVDTNLLAYLLNKYVTYHRLDSSFSYALVQTNNNEILYSSGDYLIKYEDHAYMRCLSCIWKKEYVHLSVFFPEKRKTLYSQIYGWIAMSIFFIFIIGSAFIYIIYSNIRQKKLSEIKNDFINNMTHEFKTPISTISLASEMLLAKKTNRNGVEKYANIIFEENQRMQSQVELVLRAALIDRGQLKLKVEAIDFHELLHSAVNSFNVESVGNDTRFEYELEATEPLIKADILHLRNIINNLIDNAIKYTNTRPLIKLATRNLNGGVQFSLSDNGIGMSREDQKKVFEKFYRVSTGNVHNVKGFGLGLYYVRTVVEAHRGSVSVESNLNKGSTFFVFLPK